MGKSFIEHSKTPWELKNNNGEYPGDENITIGCLQRIATATEAMAVNHVKLQNDYDYMRSQRDRYRQRYEESQRRISALKGVITKLKKKL